MQRRGRRCTTVWPSIRLRRPWECHEAAVVPPFPQVVYDESGVAVGVTSEGETAKAKMVVGSPEYFPQKVRHVGKVVRAIAFLVSASPPPLHTHTHTRTYTHSYTHTCAHAHTHTHAHTCKCTHTRTHANAQTRAHMHT